MSPCVAASDELDQPSQGFGDKELERPTLESQDNPRATRFRDRAEKPKGGTAVAQRRSAH